jgi:hypothetical protein
MLMHSPADKVPLSPQLESALELVHQWLVKIASGEIDEVFEAALAYQGKFAHAAKAGTNVTYHFLLPSAGRMERSLAALRSVVRNANPSASRR